MSKHTKGPWIIKGTLFGEWHISSEFGVDGEKLTNGRQHVACSPSASSKLNPDYFSMFMANAKLIAAAPELLAALEAFVEDIVPDDPSNILWIEARSVIAKARGES